MNVLSLPDDLLGRLAYPEGWHDFQWWITLRLGFQAPEMGWTGPEERGLIDLNSNEGSVQACPDLIWEIPDRVSWWALTAANLWSGAGNQNEREDALTSFSLCEKRSCYSNPEMAIFHLTVKTGSHLGGQSARAKADYIEREGKYERQDDELAHRESENMLEWAEDDPRSYWEAADEHERVNGRLYREVEFALPRELNEGDQVELAREFASKLTSAGGERLPYTLAVNRGKGENPHAHLMISERANDGIERSREQWFKRYNSKEPEKGGARKSMATRPKDWLEQTRKDWAIMRTRR